MRAENNRASCTVACAEWMSICMARQPSWDQNEPGKTLLLTMQWKGKQGKSFLYRAMHSSRNMSCEGSLKGKDDHALLAFGDAGGIHVFAFNMLIFCQQLAMLQAHDLLWGQKGVLTWHMCIRLPANSISEKSLARNLTCST